MAGRKGILLAGGAGTRLYPSTLGVSKQILPVFDKPMIYYPLSTLMLAGIRDILIISTPRDTALFSDLLGDGSKWGLNLSYMIQKHPDGLAQSILLATDFIGNNDCALVLGDNVFYGEHFSSLLAKANERKDGATIFTYHVDEPTRYGVAEFNQFGQVISIEEKPSFPKSNYAVTGLYFYDNDAPILVREIRPSKRNELEITDLNNLYLYHNRLYAQPLGRGFAWLDTGTHESLLEASQFIATVEHRQGLKIGCPEEIAWRNNWIDDEKLCNIANEMSKNFYGKYLYKILAQGKVENAIC